MLRIQWKRNTCTCHRSQHDHNLSKEKNLTTKPNKLVFVTVCVYKRTLSCARNDWIELNRDGNSHRQLNQPNINNGSIFNFRSISVNTFTRTTSVCQCIGLFLAQAPHIKRNSIVKLSFSYDCSRNKHSPVGILYFSSI